MPVQIRCEAVFVVNDAGLPMGKVVAIESTAQGYLFTIAEKEAIPKDAETTPGIALLPANFKKTRKAKTK